MGRVSESLKLKLRVAELTNENALLQQALTELNESLREGGPLSLDELNEKHTLWSHPLHDELTVSPSSSSFYGDAAAQLEDSRAARLSLSRTVAIDGDTSRRLPSGGEVINGQSEE